MSGRSPSKRGRKKKSNKGRKPKKPLSKEEIAAKKNQKNMRETCRRVEINLHYELLYHSLGQNLVYNRAERVQLLRKAIIKMAELKAQVISLTDQVRAAGMTPRSPPRFQLNDSQKLFMLVQRWARNDSGKKCSRAKLKPVGIEIIDDNGNVPITTPRDGRRVSDQLCCQDSDHIPFWASWETNTYIVVDQDAFEKACNQAIIAGWDGKLGSKGAYYQRGLPLDCGLTIASSIYSSNTNNSKYIHDDDEDDDDDDSDDDTQLHHDETKYIHRIQRRNNHNAHHAPLFPPRIDFPEIVDGIHHNMSHSLSDSRSENNSVSTSEPPIKKQKLNDGRSKNMFAIHHSLPLSVPFPAVGVLNGSPFMNVESSVKPEPIHVARRVQLPHFLAAFPPPPSSHQLSNTHNLVPVSTFPMFPQNIQRADSKDNIKEDKNTEETPPPPSNNNDLSPSGSRTSHETRNSVVFTPANRKNSSAISTDSTTPDQIRTKSPSPHNKVQAIHLPDNTSFLNHQLNWNGNHSNRECDEYSNYDVLSSHHIGMMNEIPVNVFQDGANSNNGADGNGMKGSVFYG